MQYRGAVNVAETADGSKRVAAIQTLARFIMDQFFVTCHGVAEAEHVWKIGRPATLTAMLRTLRAARFLFVGPFVLVLLVIINLMTSPHHWWVQWAALGIGIAWVASLLRVIRAAIVLGGLAALIAYLRKK